MKKDEEGGEEKAEFGCCGISCCIPRGDSGRGEQMDTGNLMASCAAACRWFPLVPVVLGAVFLLLGYYLAPEVIRALWIVAAAVAVAMGLLGLVITGRMARRFRSKCFRVPSSISIRVRISLGGSSTTTSNCRPALIMSRM